MDVVGWQAAIEGETDLEAKLKKLFLDRREIIITMSGGQ